MLMPKRMLAIAAAAALGSAVMAGGAIARPMGGVHSFNHANHSFGHPGGVGRGFAFRGHRGGFYGGGLGGLYAYGGPSYGYGGCWVHRRIWTPYGWRWRLVEIC
ncbi:MAG: sulfur globule protein precursor [Xanthobacteraceae bacterium]